MAYDRGHRDSEAFATFSAVFRKFRRAPGVSKKEAVLELGGREITVTNPDKVFFPQLGKTKLDLVRYYVSVADGALRSVADRPMNLKRFPNGAGGEPFFQKRAPEPRPDWVRTATVEFPSRRTAPSRPHTRGAPNRR